MVKDQHVHKYVGISAFVYSMDFARWLMTLKSPDSNRFLLEFPSPSTQSSREACLFVCKVGNLTSLFAQHIYTSHREAPGRCFDVCYVSVIMQKLLNDHEQTDQISFMAEVCFLYFIHLIFVPGPRCRTRVDARILSSRPSHERKNPSEG